MSNDESSDKAYPHQKHPEVLVVKFGRRTDFRSHLQVIYQSWHATAQPTLAIYDLSNVSAEHLEYYAQSMGRGIRAWQVMLPDDDWKLIFVVPDNNERENLGLVTRKQLQQPSFSQEVVESIEEATTKLLPFRKPLLLDSRLNLEPFNELFQSSNLVFVGADETDLQNIPNRFRRAGVNVRDCRLLKDHDFVVFCMSVLDGPLQPTKSAIACCSGRNIRPLAIVRTRSDELADQKLTELVVMEEMDLISKILPKETVEGLPWYLHFDPGLVCKVAKLMKDNKVPILCKSIASE